MNELRRMAYLDALEIDCYVSRAQLPGAAPTRRLAIVPALTGTTVAKGAVDSPEVSESAVIRVSPMEREGITLPDLHPAERSASVALPPDRSPDSQPLLRFRLSMITAGDWLWLEELGDMPLATAQVQLVKSMAQALILHRRKSSGVTESTADAKAGSAELEQFEWPLHNNRQLDQSEDAARASVAAFVSRRLEEGECRGVVLLGQACGKRIPLSQMNLLAVSTASSAEILASPALKRQVWQDLQPLLHKP